MTAIAPNTPGGYIVGAQKLAIDYINEDNSILSNYKLCLTVLDTDENKEKAVSISLELVDSSNTLNNINDTIPIPFVLGVTYSVLSITTNPILSAFNWAQISSASTSVLLSDIKSYPTFYRTVPSDLYQSKGIALLCKHFNWTRLGILHTGDPFGVYLTNNILELGNEYNFKAYAISFADENQESIINAVKTIQNLGFYIIVVIAHESELNITFSLLDEYKLMGFPYFYIGVDSWFDTARINLGGLAKYSKGLIGLVPWQPVVLTPTEYAQHGLSEMYDTAIKLYQQIETAWNDEYKINPSFSTNFSTMNTKSIYGWDSTWALAMALDIYDKEYNLSTIRDTKIEIVSNRLQDIIKRDEYYFLSVTGNVSFDENGDRKHALYAFGNVIDDNGTVRYFGYFGGDDIIHVDFENIIWPKRFQEKNITPMSSILITYEIEDVHSVVAAVFTALSLLSAIFVFLILFLTFKWRNNKVITNILWKLNILTCIGCIILQIIIILCAFDLTDTLCVVREWLFCISFSLVFMPLFMKTWKLSVVYSGILQDNYSKIKDYVLVLGVICCLIIDIAILLIFTLIDASHVLNVDGDIKTIHALHDVQMQYIVCSKSSIRTYNVFIIVMCFWKFMQLTFGLFVAFSISRIPLEMKKLNHFNETQSLLIATFCTIIIFMFAGIILMFISSNETIEYIIISTVGLLISNIVLIGNVCPRVWAVYSHNEYKFLSTESEHFRKTLHQFIKKKHYNKKYIREIIHETQREKDIKRMDENEPLTPIRECW